MASVDKDFEQLEGIITPSQWDATGQIVEVHLALPGEVNVPLMAQHLTPELCRIVGTVVRIEGRMTPTHYFQVDNYKIIKLFKGEI